MTLDERARDCGAIAYLSKPFEPEELIGIVENTLGQEGGAKTDKNKIPV